MKKFFSLFVLIVVTHIALAQVYYSENASKIIPEAEIIRFKDFSEVPVFIKFKKGTYIAENKFISVLKNFLKQEDLSFIKTQTQKNKEDELTVRYAQSYRGIPIEFTRWHVTVSNGKILFMNGEIFHKIDVNFLFIINKNEALENALKYVNAEIYMWEDSAQEEILKKITLNPNASYYPTAEKVIVPKDINLDSELRTAYKFDIFSLKPYTRKNIYVDAITGEILFEMNKMFFESDEVGTAVTQYSGQQQINTLFNGQYYVLNDRTRGDGIQTLNCNNGIDYSSATEFTDNDNYWNNINEQLDQYATDAHFATMSTYDYFLDVHNRNSIDGYGYQLWSFVHFNLVDYGMSSNVNAFWNGQYMTYGDGDPGYNITPLTTLDICGHEISHGLTSCTSNLNYINESGSLNEAFSDIFGTAIEFYAVPQYADWTIGEDIGMTMRSMANPKSLYNPDTYHGQYWEFGTTDYGGVHTNNGPMCYMFYLLCEGGNGTNDLGNTYSVDAIGIDKAEAIMYRIQTVYLTPNSNYQDAWFYSMQATADLYGACSNEVKAVGDAFYAIGVADPYEASVHADFNAIYTESCEPPFVVQFNNQSYNGDDFLWNFGDGETSTEINPAHMYTDFGSYDVTLTVSGACGNQEITKENFVLIDASIPCINTIPMSGNTIIEACSGFIFDVGGPNENYYDNSDGSLTIIAPEQNQILLNILEFDIEAGSEDYCDYDFLVFYDGSSTSDPIINDTYYCNTTGNPETILSTGNSITIRFYSDEALSLAGFKIQFDCIGNENPPTAYFTASPLNSCNGEIQFTDNSINNPTNWFWDFGDGTNSIEQNPIHIYYLSGLYPVSLTVSNDFGEDSLMKNDYIMVNLHEFPQQNNFEACDGEPFNIDIQSLGNVFWYYQIDDPEPFFIGNHYEHEAVNVNETSTIKYYLRELFPGQNVSVGEIENTTGGGYFGNPSYIHYLIFDAYTSFVLDSVKVNAYGDGIRTIALRSSDQQIIEQKTVFCPDGISYIPLNIIVPAGQNLQLAGLGSPYLFRTDASGNLSYPYTVSDIVSIKYSSATSTPTQYYYYFYDWHISTFDCISEFYELNIPVNICDNVDNYSLNNFNIYPNPSNGIIHLNSDLDLLGSIIKITNVKGQVVLELKISDSKIDLSFLPSGIYNLTLITNDIVLNKKLIIY